MLTIILISAFLVITATLIGVGVFLKTRRRGNSSDAPFWGIMYTFIVLFFVFIVGGMISGHSPDKVTSSTHTYQLEALTTGAPSLSGHFFLGSGTLGSTPEYQYVVKRDGAYYSEQTPSEGVPTFATKDGSAYVTVTTKTEYANWFFPGYKIPLDKPDSYAFHIPAGSIVQNYNITGPKN